MKTETAEAAETARSHRDALVDRLCDWQVVRSPQVEAAMRSVPRHQFVPEVSVESAYADKAIHTKWTSDGVLSSSASQPTVVAWQLEQLQAQPGDRVLEIGAGTGYNAALLAEIVGPTGEVTTIDFDPEVADRARQALAATDYGHVCVISADGEYGCAEHAPYDRLIVTTGAWDVPPTWTTQLTPSGRLVVPLRLPGWPMSIAFDRTDDYWRSVSTQSLGFIPIDGAGAFATQTVAIGADAVLLRIDNDREVDTAALAVALDHPRSEVWTGVVVDNGASWDHLYLWLAALRPGFCKFNTTPDAIEHGIVKPIMGWGGAAIYDGDSFAYLTNRRANNHIKEPPFELGIFAHGPHSADLAGQLAAQIRTWHQDFRATTTIRIEVHPIDTPAVQRSTTFLINKRHSQIAISFPTV